LNILYESHSLAPGALFWSFTAASLHSKRTLIGLNNIQKGFHKNSTGDFLVLKYFHFATIEAAFLAFVL